MDKPSKWEDCLHLVEFAYNDGYHASLKMSPFEVSSMLENSTHVSWDNPIGRIVLGPHMLHEIVIH